VLAHLDASSRGGRGTPFCRGHGQQRGGGCKPLGASSRAKMPMESLYPWIEKPVKNQSIFTKTGETDLNRFYRFLINRPVNFLKFLIFLKNDLPVNRYYRFMWISTITSQPIYRFWNQFTGHIDQ
jgi:hypothetical protein